MHYLKLSLDDKHITDYHLEAGIAAEHCLAKIFETTNWQSIYHQYQKLEILKPSPIIALNLAIIQSKTEGIENSRKSLEGLTKEQALINYQLLPATQGILYLKLGNYKIAIDFLRQALNLIPSAIEKKFIKNKILECQRGITGL
ncbi:MAG: hypothetical protein IPL46_14365 [Saprospiraceae bacterium]|nr:hypothetical protein [Saprospiraceae bacterium]